MIRDQKIPSRKGKANRSNQLNYIGIKDYAKSQSKIKYIFY